MYIQKVQNRRQETLVAETFYTSKKQVKNTFKKTIGARKPR